ncbi:MAG: hypothetical protein N4A61_13795 [Pelagimonas sp.]|jgi:hypothetical protein|nr:hypothetical protein [Pelagimonas sp.]
MTPEQSLRAAILDEPPPHPKKQSRSSKGRGGRKARTRKPFRFGRYLLKRLAIVLVTPILLRLAYATPEGQAAFARFQSFVVEVVVIEMQARSAQQAKDQGHSDPFDEAIDHVAPVSSTSSKAIRLDQGNGEPTGVTVRRFGG